MNKTIQYYDNNAATYFKSTVNLDLIPNDLTQARDIFLSLLISAERKPRILDIGSGSGRDAVFYSKHGCSVTALEPSEGLCERLSTIFHGDVVNSAIQDYEPSEPFDGLWACASLLHLERCDIINFFSRLNKFMKSGSILYCDFKTGIKTGFDEKGRFFTNFDEELFEAINDACPGLQLEKKWENVDVSRPGLVWVSMIFRML